MKILAKLWITARGLNPLQRLLLVGMVIFLPAGIAAAFILLRFWQKPTVR